MVSLKKTTFVLLFAVLCISINAHEDYKCNHDSIKQNPGTLFVEEDFSSLNQGSDGDGRALQSTSNMRIHVYYGYLEQTAPSDYAAYIQTVVQAAADYFQGALKVKYPVVGNLQVGSNVRTICERNTPSELISGVPADFYMYYDSEAVSGYQIANTEHCYLASGTNRPLIGRTMINRNMMKMATGDVLVHEQNIYVLMHEMTHALGFSSSLFTRFIDANAQQLSGQIRTVSLGGNSRQVLDVAPLTDKLRNYYGCSTLPGAILENNGGDSTASSHFERKYFLYEYMTSGAMLGMRISEFTLALLEGSGWYQPDYSYAEPYFFGQGQGCSFLNTQCSSSNTPFPDDYCTQSTMGCAPVGMGGGFCSNDPISDGCKFYYPAESNYCENPNGGDNTRLGSLQVYGRGLGSRCFAGTLNTRQSNSIASFCFKYTCSGSGMGTQLTVQVGSETVTCTQEGPQTINGYYGAINCPDPMTFCNGPGLQFCPRNCMGRGTCVNNQCQCDSGYSGTDCALSG